MRVGHDQRSPNRSVAGTMPLTPAGSSGLRQKRGAIAAAAQRNAAEWIDTKPRSFDTDIASISEEQRDITRGIDNALEAGLCRARSDRRLQLAR
jgi:hypothetical protein